MDRRATSSPRIFGSDLMMLELILTRIKFCNYLVVLIADRPRLLADRSEPLERKFGKYSTRYRLCVGRLSSLARQNACSLVLRDHWEPYDKIRAAWIREVPLRGPRFLRTTSASACRNVVHPAVSRVRRSRISRSDAGCGRFFDMPPFSNL